MKLRFNWNILSTRIFQYIIFLQLYLNYSHFHLTVILKQSPSH
nr:MAG TPA: hypothetical protein [Caudoviricetes sp.]